MQGEVLTKVDISKVDVKGFPKGYPPIQKTLLTLWGGEVGVYKVQAYPTM